MEAFFHLGALGEIISFAYNIEPILSIRPFDMYNTDHGEIPTLCNCFQCLRLRIKKNNLLSQPFDKKKKFFFFLMWKLKSERRRKKKVRIIRVNAHGAIPVLHWILTSTTLFLCLMFKFELYLESLYVDLGLDSLPGQNGLLPFSAKLISLLPFFPN